MHSRNIFMYMTLAAGLFLSPILCQKALPQSGLPDSSTLNSIAQGNIPEKPGKMQLKQIENALRQNMQSAEFLMKTAKAAGASPQDLAEMEKMSIGFMKLFLTSITPTMSQPGEPKPAPAKPMPPQAAPGKPMPPQAGKPMPPQGMLPQAGKPMHPQAMPPQAGKPMPPQGMPPQGMPPQTVKPMPQQQIPQGIIITAPDGSQWLVTPQQQPMPPAHGMMPQPPMQAPADPTMKPQQPMQAVPGMNQPQGQNPSLQQNQPEEIIIIEEDVIGEMPLWPTKEQLGKDGVLKYLEKRNNQMQ